VEQSPLLLRTRSPTAPRRLSLDREPSPAAENPTIEYINAVQAASESARRASPGPVEISVELSGECAEVDG
jgi:hypothetical protein